MATSLSDSIHVQGFGAGLLPYRIYIIRFYQTFTYICQINTCIVFRLYNQEIHTVEREQQNYRSPFGCIFKPWVTMGWVKQIYIYIYLHMILFLYVDNHLPLIYIYHHHHT